MCCNYCYHFKECKKAKKAGSDCCQDCAEQEYCPFILGEKAGKDYDPAEDTNPDLDIFGGEEF